MGESYSKNINLSWSNIVYYQLDKSKVSPSLLAFNKFVEFIELVKMMY